MNTKWIDLEYSVMNNNESIVSEHITLQDCIKGRATVKQYQEYLRKLTGKIKSKNDYVRVN